MLTLDSLTAWGANTKEGLGRCFNNQDFYLRLVGMAIADANFDKLKAAMDASDSKAAFEAAHALKGSLGNLSLTPIYDPVCELTEQLRAQTGPVEADALMERIFSGLETLRQMNA